MGSSRRPCNDGVDGTKRTLGPGYSGDHQINRSIVKPKIPLWDFWLYRFFSAKRSSRTTILPVNAARRPEHFAGRLTTSTSSLNRAFYFFYLVKQALNDILFYSGNCKLGEPFDEVYIVGYLFVVSWSTKISQGGYLLCSFPACLPFFEVFKR